MTARGRTTQLFSILIIVGMMMVLAFPITQSEAPIEEEPDGTPAGWSDDINLSNDPVYRDNLPQVAVSGNNIHVVWLHNYQDIFYSKSVNGGKSWIPPVNIYHSTSNLGDPYIGVANNTVYIVWSAVLGVRQTLLCKSIDNGNTWNNTVTVFNSPSTDSYCWGLYVNDTNIHIISEDYRDGTNGEIYYRRSLDGGITWDNGQGVDEDRRITFGLTTKVRMRINGDGAYISIAWSDERDGDWDIYWMISKDNGYAWEDGLGVPHAGRKISDTPDDSIYPRVTMNGLNIYIVWDEMTWPGPEYWLYYRNSTNGGITWSTQSLLVGPWSGISQMDLDVESDNIHLTWGDTRNGSYQIHYKNSTDGGTTWGGAVRLSYNLSRDSLHPKIDVENNNIHIVWYDIWPGNGDREIYYKRFPDFPPDPIYNITLNEGWNLVSLPLEQRDEALDKALENITGKWDYILAYNASDPDKWKTNNTLRPDQLNDLKTLDHKMSFWINITEPGGCVLTVSGTIPATTQIPLKAGWNLVGYPTQTTETVANALWGTGADKVEVFNASQPYNLAEVGPNYVMKPGEGYWVHVPANSVWVIDW